ncbi:putative metalloprotease CJM1_0395 family protein [Solemya velesiana gill symbiont]|uniref:SprA-related family protein n=1 Tax=Solemya velesiana gill symbiont TaxID=1918948 RepID=A0A1T2KRB6_9GAMM|nr:putative metalloprotease CJM1_0395 family protein [Solemya velesiana gill symbiont]OOZ35393.1 hypothetical protein BOW51_11355 [Solemya velesiana gill symbiont]
MEITSLTLHPYQGQLSNSTGKGTAQENSKGKTATEETGNGLEKERLTTQEQTQVRKLQRRDREARAHEQAHIAAGGGVVRGGASFQYTRGPDGKLYAAGGEVAIDTSGVRGNPQATALKAETIKRAALAPANPSSQDLQVAAAATLMAATARAEIRVEAREELKEATEANSPGTPGNSLQQKLSESGALEDEEKRGAIDTFV